MLQGDAVNLAARLMGKANGRILIDDNTFLRLPTSVSQNLQLNTYCYYYFILQYKYWCY